MGCLLLIVFFLAPAPPGENLWGQVGSGDGSIQSPVPTLVAGRLRWILIDAAYYHTCGVAEDHSAWCWGRNAFGQLGDGTITDRPTPVEVIGGEKWHKLSGSFRHTCGIKLDGSAWCWGESPLEGLVAIRFLM